MQGLREADSSKLAAYIRSKMRYGNLSSDGGDIDDAALTPCQHLWQDRLYRLHHREVLEFHGLTVRFDWQLLDWADVNYAGAVNQHVDSAPMFRCVLNQALAI